MGKTALMVMDVQNGIVERFSGAGDLAPLQSAVHTARDKGIAVIFVRVAMRAGYADVSPNNRSFSAIRNTQGLLENDLATQIWEGVQPEGDEVVVVKRRASAFAGSGLELVLRSMEVDHLILTGIATSGVVLSTLRQAADLDFRLTVLSDACLDAPAPSLTLTELEEWLANPGIAVLVADVEGVAGVALAFLRVEQSPLLKERTIAVLRE